MTQEARLNPTGRTIAETLEPVTIVGPPSRNGLEAGEPVAAESEELRVLRSIENLLARMVEMMEPLAERFDRAPLLSGLLRR